MSPPGQVQTTTNYRHKQSSAHDQEAEKGYQEFLAAKEFLHKPKKFMTENDIMIEDFGGKIKSQTMPTRKSAKPRRDEFFGLIGQPWEASCSAQKYKDGDGTVNNHFNVQMVANQNIGDSGMIAHINIEGKLHRLNHEILTKQKHRFDPEDWQFLRKVMDKKKLISGRKVNKFHLANPINFKYIKKSKYLDYSPEEADGPSGEPSPPGATLKNKKVQLIVNKYLNQ